MACSTWTENLITARNQAAELLVQITASPRPSYNVHQHHYSWAEYQKVLMDSIAGLNKLIAQGDFVDEVGFGV
jgi:hypothetical protein